MRPRRSNCCSDRTGRRLVIGIEKENAIGTERENTVAG
jgi:hypothetical protein